MLLFDAACSVGAVGDSYILKLFGQFHILVDIIFSLDSGGNLV